MPTWVEVFPLKLCWPHLQFKREKQSGDVAQLAEYLPSIHKALDSVSTPTRGSNAQNSGTSEVEVGGTEVRLSLATW